MKKLVILSFASILLLTGCGATETLSCTYENNATNGTTKVSYDIDHEQDEIKKVRITYKYNFNNNNNAENNDTNNNNDVNAANNTDNNIATYNNGNNNTNNNDNNDMNNNNVNNNDNNNQMDGVGTGTDGTTNDTQIDDDGIVDGIVGSAIDTIVGGVTGIILDSAGLRDRHANVQNTYGNINGFSVQNTNDSNDNYTVTYVIDYDTISDNDLARFNLTRDLDLMRDNYVNQGFTCK